MRVAFRLDTDDERVWLKLKARHEGRTDTYIFRQLLRDADYKMQGNSKDDRLNEIKAMLQEILDILRGNYADPT